jgi:hypothetical protein
MIGEVLAGVRMHEDRQLSAVEREPLGKFAEPIRRDRQLHASARVRADRTQVVMADGDAEALLRLVAKRPRCLDFLRVEIDVGVEIADHGGAPVCLLH